MTSNEIWLKYSVFKHNMSIGSMPKNGKKIAFIKKIIKAESIKIMYKTLYCQGEEAWQSRKKQAKLCLAR